MRTESDMKRVLWQFDGLNGNIHLTVAESGSDPNPRTSLRRDADVMALMLQNVDELTDDEDMLSVTLWR